MFENVVEGTDLGSTRGKVSSIPLLWLYQHRITASVAKKGLDNLF